MTDIRIYVANLAKYNEGRLVGTWIDLPMNENDLQNKITAILGHDEEIAIHDYEAPFNIEEFTSPQYINALAERLNELDKHDQKKVLYLVGNGNYDWEGAFNSYEDVTFYEGMTMIQVAESLVDEGCFGDIPTNIQNYIDYEAIARDLSCDGYDETDEGVFQAQ